MNYWLVRADWGIHGGGNQFQKFIEEKIWENGYNDKFQKTVNSIEVGDTLLLADKSNIKYSAICSRNDSNGKNIEVEEWLKFDNPILFAGKGAYAKTITRFASEKILVEILKELSKRKLSRAFIVENIVYPVYLEAIKIKNYFSIIDIEITNLKDRKEIYFVGANGDGKTILLQAILLALKKEYSGQIIEYIRDIEDGMELLIKDEVSETYNKYKNIKNVFAYGINRNKTREKFDIYGYSGLFDTNDFKETTFLKNPLDILKSDNELVKKLNEYILVHSLKIENIEGKVLFKEDKNIVEFERLSEGFRSTIIWICDLVSRLRENSQDIDKKNQKIETFKAIVLIDEIDLYLHPKWKYDFVYNLRKVFPNIQFIMITHSTATILGASEKAIFYKVYKEDGETKISHPMDNIKNLMANNLSTSPLFDMDTARARNSDNNLETAEDFIYTKIHQIIAKRVKGKKSIIEDDIVNMIDKELDDYLKENGLL